MSDNLEQLYGDYTADVDAKFASTPRVGLSKMADTTNWAAGCPDNKCTNYSKTDIVKAVTDVQLVVICVGTGEPIQA